MKKRLEWYDHPVTFNERRDLVVLVYKDVLLGAPFFY
jgi:hypothetical protein